MRHRKITASAFSEATCREVWGETVRRAEMSRFRVEKYVEDRKEEEGETASLRDVRSVFDHLAMQVLAVVVWR
jgi:hypothetical protein